jgi:hypothetical protein
MARLLSISCCLLVGLQFLVGVPVAVCLAFVALYGGLGPISIEVHPGASPAPTLLFNGPTVPPPESPQAPLALALPPNVIPQQAAPAIAAAPDKATTIDNPIVQTRATLGNPFAGTVLDQDPHADDVEYLVAAFGKLEAQDTTSLPAAQPSAALTTTADAAPTCSATPCCSTTSTASGATCSETAHPSEKERANEFVIQHLYEMADRDERAGNYARADQWRALAREIRQSGTPGEAANMTASDALELPLVPVLP